ncbi:MAG: hypothetical protein ACREEM_48330 [Blastocatellia bacterium]
MNENLPTSKLDNEREQASEREMVKYFLGNLHPEEERQLEELFFADDQLFGRLQAVKEKLIDDFLHERLNESDRRLFERNFLSSPSQREQVEFARTLMHQLSQSS